MASIQYNDAQGIHANKAARGKLNTAHPDFIRIVHRAKIDDRYKTYLCLMGICAPCSCLICMKDQIYDSTYVQVHENRLEFNYPGGFSMFSCCLSAIFPACCCIKDDVQVFYFDTRRMENVGRAGFCTPACTHCSFFPTCCDICGQGAVFYSNCCPCQNHFVLRCLQDADALVTHVQQAKMATVITVAAPAI